jgi:Cys-rich four helix bundle protein (predicted Tat secretion target)
VQRRELLTGLGLAAAVTAIPNAAAQAPHHHHGTAAYQTLADKASDCVSKGEVCLTHCYELLAEGDKSMASCAKSVREMLALCGALRSIASQEAPSLPKLAAVAQDACTRCEAECRKHEETHAPCKACAESCAACAAECKKVAA